MRSIPCQQQHEAIGAPLLPARTTHLRVALAPLHHLCHLPWRPRRLAHLQEQQTLSAAEARHLFSKLAEELSTLTRTLHGWGSAFAAASTPEKWQPPPPPLPSRRQGHPPHDQNGHHNNDDHERRPPPPPQPPLSSPATADVWRRAVYYGFGDMREQQPPLSAASTARAAGSAEAPGSTFKSVRECVFSVKYLVCGDGGLGDP